MRKPFDSIVLCAALPLLGLAWLLVIEQVLLHRYSVEDVPGDPQLRYLWQVTLLALAVATPAALLAGILAPRRAIASALLFLSPTLALLPIVVSGLAPAWRFVYLSPAWAAPALFVVYAWAVRLTTSCSRRPNAIAPSAGQPSRGAAELRR